MSKILLPTEIEELIFEHAAYMHPRYAHTFSVVSKHIQLCVEKIMYKSLIVVASTWNLPHPLPETAAFGRILPTFQKRPAEFFATRVQNILFFSEMPREYAKLILEKCSGVRNLSYWPFHIKDPGPWSLPCAHALESLYTSADAFQGLAESTVVFPRLTHLSVDKIYPGFILPSLEWLPSLKELYLYDHDDWEGALKTVASTAPGLRRLTLDVHTDYMIAIGQWVERNPSSIEVRVGDIDDADGDIVEEWRSMFTDFVPWRL